MTNKKNLIILALLLVVAIYGYYQYNLQKIPQKIAQSQEAIFNVDSLRFTFKVSVLAQKGLNKYMEASTTKNEDAYYDAIDYIHAATAFSDIGYINDPKFTEKISKLLNQASQILEQYKLNPPKEALDQLAELIEQTSFIAEQKEQNTWKYIQKKYIDFNTQEYKLSQLYEAITIAVSIFLLVIAWLSIIQQRLIRVNKSHQKQLQQLAYFDPLTKIANRKNIENVIDTKIKLCKRKNLSFYLALIDLDNYKKINDLLGHDAGDELLQNSVKRFNAILRKEDLIGRFGGDEFLVVFNEHTTQEEFLKVITRVQASFEKPVSINETEFNVTTSIGIANYPKDIIDSNNNSVQHLIKYADIAMYQAKKLGKNQISFYNHQLEALIQFEHKMDKEIKRALQNGEFELYYQPQISSHDMLTHSAEALVRWNHPDKGLIMPGEFIEYIEKGLSTVEFGEWVVETAVEQQKKWHMQGIDLNISLNLSVKHILSPDFFHKMTALLSLLDANLQHLAFEITEYELISSDKDAIHTLERLEHAGLKFHLDDFGTGYSSISYLNQLPIDTIKIDKSFIDYIKPHEGKQDLVKAIIDLGSSLNKRIIAEGIENEYQASFLKESGCHIFQGYLYSKPLPAEDLEAFYKNNHHTDASSVKETT